MHNWDVLVKQRTPGPGGEEDIRTSGPDEGPVEISVEGPVEGPVADRLVTAGTSALTTALTTALTGAITAITVRSDDASPGLGDDVIRAREELAALVLCDVGGRVPARRLTTCMKWSYHHSRHQSASNQHGH